MTYRNALWGPTRKLTPTWQDFLASPLRVRANAKAKMTNRVEVVTGALWFSSSKLTYRRSFSLKMFRVSLPLMREGCFKKFLQRL